VILNKKQIEALQLKLGPVRMRNLTTVVKVNGQLAVPPASSADVTAIIGGNVKEIRVFFGDRVRKGQVLAVLEHPDYVALQEDFAAIAHRLGFLKKEYERQKKLFENNVGAGRDFQRVKSEYNTARARYQGLKSRLLLLHLSPDMVKQGKISNTINVVSHINGYVNTMNIKVGTYVDARDKLFEIADNNAIHADFMVYEKDVYLVKKGQKVHFTVSNMPGKELTATVFAIGKEFEPNTRSVHIHANIHGDKKGLIPGMYISGHLHTDEKYTRALPNEAIVKEGTKSYIFVRDDSVIEEMKEHDEKHQEEQETGHDDISHDGMAFRMVEIIPGRKDEGYTEIHPVDSLPDNTQIVLNTAYYLLADMKKEEAEHDH
jgi:cobalt-zinc-cadmium efflux system membrane fusion protein